MSLIDSAREGLSRHPYYASAFLVAFTLGVLFVGWKRSTSSAFPPHASHKVWVLDESTGEVGVRDSREVPPLTNNGGQPTVVQAVFYTYDGGQTKKLAYLQKYSEEAKAALLKILDHPATAGDPNMHQVLKDGTFIRSPEPGSAWVAIDSPEAAQISSAALRDCPQGAMPQIALPQ